MPKATATKNVTGSVIEQPSTTLGTLAAKTGILTAGPAVTRGGKMLSSSIQGSLFGGTSGDPSVQWGVANGDITLAELEAFLELDGPKSPAEISEGEIASRGRYIRTLGVLSPDPANRHVMIDIDNESLKGLKFSESGEPAVPGWNWWFYNQHPSAAMTTGGVVIMQCRNFVEWNPSG